MRKLRILLLTHEDTVPPEDPDSYSEKESLEWVTELDVINGLRELGHEVEVLGVSADLGKIRNAIIEFNPRIAFNLLEAFHGVAVYDHHVVSYLELMQLQYTGCNPRGLMLSHDKALSKKLLSYHRIRTPKFLVFPVGRAVKRPPTLHFPLFVKSVVEEASLGISQASIVRSDEKLKERVRFVHEQLKTDAIAEEYIEGRELYVGVIGNSRLQTFPVWELEFTKRPDHLPNIASAKAKWNPDYQEKHGIQTRAARKLDPALEARFIQIAKRVYRALYLTGYSRMDFRLTEEGEIYVLEANPNPYLAYHEDFASSAMASGLSYNEILQKILSLGMRYQAEWKTLA